MTIIVSIPSQLYTPRTVNLSPTIPSGTKRVVATLTREAWPVGRVAGVYIVYPDGIENAGVEIDGGVQTDKSGPVLRTGIAIAGKSGADLPAGQYAVTVRIDQTITTSVVVERF